MTMREAIDLFVVYASR